MVRPYTPKNENDDRETKTLRLAKRKARKKKREATTLAIRHMADHISRHVTRALATVLASRNMTRHAPQISAVRIVAHALAPVLTIRHETQISADIHETICAAIHHAKSLFKLRCEHNKKTFKLCEIV